MKARILVLLGAVILVSGCTAPLPGMDLELDLPLPDFSPGFGPDQQENETNRTMTRTGAVTTMLYTNDPTIFAGGETRLVLEITNQRETALDDVTATVGNRGRLTVIRQAPTAQQAGMEEHQCRYNVLPVAADAGDSWRCIWLLRAPQDLVGETRQSVTFPLNIFLTYPATLSTEQSLQATFAAEHRIRPGDSMRDIVRATNNEIELVAEHESPVPAESGEVPLTVTVRNVGNGVIAGDDGDRSLTLRFSGTLADAVWAHGRTTCAGPDRERTVTLPEDASSTSFSCVIALNEPDLAGKTFFLRPHLTYRYRLVDETTLTVANRN